MLSHRLPLAVTDRQPDRPRPRVIMHALPESSHSPALAREIMRDALAGFADDQVGVAELLVSELATNAIVHAESMLIVHVEVSAGGFKVSVEDCSYVEPMPRWDVPDDSPGGRGLLWVDAMADSWGWERTETGKLVWFALASDSS